MASSAILLLLLGFPTADGSNSLNVEDRQRYRHRPIRYLMDISDSGIFPLPGEPNLHEFDGEDDGAED